MPDDSRLWCEDCQVGYEGDCVQHGPLTRVNDTEVDTRARRSVPNILLLRDQQDFTGVYAKRKVLKRIQFGPLLAIKVEEGSKKAKEATEYITSRGGLLLWVSENGGGTKYLLDTRQEERTNWMCFVRAAKFKGQQNVVAFQYRGQIFFVTIKEIPAECELRVWYSKDYAERMGRAPLPEERISWQFRTRDRFLCSGCSVVFSSSSALANHKCSKSGNGGGQGSSSSTTGKSILYTPPAKQQESLLESIVSSRPAVEANTSLTFTRQQTLSSTSRSLPPSLIKISGSRVGIRKGKRKPPLQRSSEAEQKKKTLKETLQSVEKEVSETPVSAVESKSSGSIRTLVSDDDVKSIGRTSEEHLSAIKKSEGIIIEKTASHVREGETSIESDIRAQVLQSVHSISSSDLRFGALQQDPLIESRKEETKVQHPFSKGEERGETSRESLQTPLEVQSEVDAELRNPTSEGEERSLETESEDRVCTVCGETGQHSCPIKSFPCDQCNKSFSSRFKLSRHQLIHGGERLYSCLICNRSFRRKDHLQNHSQIHAPHKQYKCEKAGCGREYNSYMSFKKHRAFHSAEEGDLQCKFCHKMFENKEEIIIHLKEHVGTRSVKSPSERKFQCDQCERKFFTRKDVKRHMVVHTGTRDFGCTLCPQKFGRKDHLVRHIKKSHGVTDSPRVDPLTDPLSLPGPSGLSSSSAPLSPGLSSVSTSSGEATSYTYLLAPSPVPHAASPPALATSLASFQDETPFSSFSGDTSDLLLGGGGGPETIKEEPELTASVTQFSPDISNILGLYLPHSEGINMSILPSALVYTSGHQVLQPPPPYSDPAEYEALSPVQFSSPHTSPIHLQERLLEEQDVVDVVTTTASQSLPGFDQTFQ